MKNVTISMDEDLAAWARVEAAKEGKSLSRYVADVLSGLRSRPGHDESLNRLREFLEGPGYPGISRALPSKDEIYGDREEEILSRHKRPRLRP
jgi:hypothetical protein